MRLPLLIHVYRSLHRGYGRMSAEARLALRGFVRSQRRGKGYAGPGGVQDDYYSQFGRTLEAVFMPWKLLGLSGALTVTESEDKSSVYGHFFRFIADEMRPGHAPSFPTEVAGGVEVSTTNAVCCLLCMQHQTGATPDAGLVRWLRDRQNECGGFHASETAPVPDLLSTAVALFTLRLIGQGASDASDFVDAHFQTSGGFSPTIYDDYSDVEYCFYGLLGLGSI